MGGAARSIAYGQLTFVATCCICLLLDGGAWLSHSGISFYGNFRDTLVPYTVGLSVAALCIMRAADRLPVTGADARFLAWSLRLSGLAVLGTVLTPSLAGAASSAAHIFFSGGLFVVQTMASARLASLSGRAIDRWLWWLQIVAVVVVLLSFRRVGVLPMMLPAQLLAVLAFTTLCVRAAGWLERVPGTLMASEIPQPKGAEPSQR